MNDSKLAHTFYLLISIIAHYVSLQATSCSTSALLAHTCYAITWCAMIHYAVKAVMVVRISYSTQNY